MSPRERLKVARRIVALLGEAGVRDVEVVPVRNDHGKLVVGETMIGGAVGFVRRGGELFAINVIPLKEWDRKGPLLSYLPRP